MINVKAKDGRTTMHISGSLKEWVADVVIITRNVRDAIAEQDKEAGKEFEWLMKKSFAENLPFAKEDEMEETLKRAKKEAEESVPSVSDLLKDLKTALEEVLEDAES